MKTRLRIGILVIGLGLVTLLAGCPGMPGVGGGGGGNAAQQSPPGLVSPPGMQSGGARSLMGTTVTPPDNGTLLVNVTVAGTATGFQSTRRLVFAETGVMLEGVNFDGRTKGQEQDTNRFVPTNQITSLTWKYEIKPAPPGAKPGAAGAPGGTGGAGEPRRAARAAQARALPAVRAQTAQEHGGGRTARVGLPESGARRWAEWFCWWQWLSRWRGWPSPRRRSSLTRTSASPARPSRT